MLRSQNNNFIPPRKKEVMVLLLTDMSSILEENRCIGPHSIVQVAVSLRKGRLVRLVPILLNVERDRFPPVSIHKVVSGGGDVRLVARL